jgi:hypothetical protein
MTINQIKNLKDNWDSYSSPAPNLISIQNSERFIELATALGFSVYYTCATSDESILILIKDCRGAQGWDFYNDGDFAVMTVVNGEKKFLDVGTWKEIESVLRNYSL